ncbi:Tyr recombinase domain-containing protein, partial [Durusdinium trenchii]
MSWGSPRGGHGVALVEAPGNYEEIGCTAVTSSSRESDGAGQEFNRLGTMATLNEGEPLCLTAINFPEQDAESMQEQATAGECHDLGNSSIAAIFKRAVEVLRKDGHLHSRRSNTELDHGPHCPPFPLRIRTEGWGSRLGFPHLPKFDALVSGTMAALNHLAEFEGSLEAAPDEGEGRGVAADTVAGLQDADPKLKGQPQLTWRLLKTWNANEVPNRAPPLTEAALEAMVGWSFFHGHFEFGVSLLVGFYGMLRTGELTTLRDAAH